MKKMITTILLVAFAIFLCVRIYQREKMKQVNRTLEDVFGYVKKDSKYPDTIFQKIYGFPKGIMLMYQHPARKEGLYDSINLKAIIPMKYDGVSCFSSGDLVSFEQNKKYGFLDTLGNEMIPAIYDFASSFDDELAAVKLNDRWGYINKKNKIVIPIKYELAWSFYDDRAAVQLNNRWGFIDHSGKFVIPPIYYDVVFYISERYTKAKVCTKGKYIYIDRNGKFQGDTDGDFLNDAGAVREGSTY